jgi:DNA repair/transcription protein MET18/MMS19
VKGLTSVSKVNSSVVEDITLPLLFHNLPDHSPSIEDITAREKYRSILKSLSELCIQPALFETLVIRITTKLELLSSTSNRQVPAETSEEDYRECEVAFAFDLLHCLSSVIETKIREKHVDVVKHFDRIIPRLYTLVIGAVSEKEEALFRDTRLLSIVGRISETLMWELSAE